MTGGAVSIARSARVTAREGLRLDTSRLPAGLLTLSLLLRLSRPWA